MRSAMSVLLHFFTFFTKSYFFPRTVFFLLFISLESSLSSISVLVVNLLYIICWGSVFKLPAAITARLSGSFSKYEQSVRVINFGRSHRVRMVKSFGKQLLQHNEAVFGSWMPCHDVKMIHVRAVFQLALSRSVIDDNVRSIFYDLFEVTVNFALVKRYRASGRHNFR